MKAAEVGSPDIVELLLEAGADPTVEDDMRYTAEDLAWWHGEYRMGAYTDRHLVVVDVLRNATGRPPVDRTKNTGRNGAARPRPLAISWICSSSIVISISAIVSSLSDFVFTSLEPWAEGGGLSRALLE